MTAARKKPNILLIVADDLGYGDLECYGNPLIKTPNIDRLAAEGVRCSQHYSGAPLCAPARAALLTGRYNHRCGALSVESNRGLDRIALREQTLADVLSSAGYASGLIGKWHSGLFDPRYHPNQRGFDEFAGFLNGIMDYWDWILDYNGRPVRADGRYQTDVFTDEAVHFIERHRHEPFFLCLCYHTPHSPLQAPAENVAAYRNCAGLNDAVATLYGMIDRMDWGIGQVLDALHTHGLDENTLILFTSDNGPWLGDYRHDGTRVEMARYNGPFRGQKQDVLEGGIRVPAIVRWPARIPAGRECHAMLHFCDWLPTLAAAAGAATTGRELDGVNQLPVLQGESPPAPQPRFWQFNRYDPVPHCNMAMRDGDWKLYWPRIPEAMVKLPSDNIWVQRLQEVPHFHMQVSNPPVPRQVSEPAKPELYNLADDPCETGDLAAQNPSTLARMQRAAENWFASVEAERRDVLAQYGPGD